MLYFPILHQESAGEDQVVAERALYLVVRPAVPPVSLVDPVREAIWAVDPNLPVANIGTLADAEWQASARSGLTMLLLLVAGALALALGAVGLYGVVAHAVSSRTREIGVRMALGADRARVSGMVLGQGLALAAAGLACGVLAALGVTRMLRSVLHDVSPVDPITFFTVSVLLLAVAAVASWLPARRAAALDPIEALRNE